MRWAWEGEQALDARGMGREQLEGHGGGRDCSCELGVKEKEVHETASTGLLSGSKIWCGVHAGVTSPFGYESLRVWGLCGSLLTPHTLKHPIYHRYNYHRYQRQCDHLIVTRVS